MQIYTEESLREALASLPDWQLIDGAIEKTFLFADFTQALGFIVQTGVLAEKADHHPELFNVYNKVVIRLNTHSEHAVTTKDTDLAAAIEKIVR